MAFRLLPKSMIVALFIVGFSTIGLAVGLMAAAKAPVGYQDETGFHYGPEFATTQQEELARGVRPPTFA